MFCRSFRFRSGDPRRLHRKRLRRANPSQLEFHNIGSATLVCRLQPPPPPRLESAEGRFAPECGDDGSTKAKVAPSALVAAKDVEQIDRLVAGGHASGTEARQRVPCVWLHPDNVDEAAKRGDLTRCVRDQRCVSAAEGKRGRSSLSWLPAAITPAISVTSTRVAVTTDPVAAISVDGGRANTTVRAADQSNALDV